MTGTTNCWHQLVTESRAIFDVDSPSLFRDLKDPAALALATAPALADSELRGTPAMGIEKRMSRAPSGQSARRSQNILLTWTFSGADDGIRTRDPHLGKVILFVHAVLASLLGCRSVYPVSIESA